MLWCGVCGAPPCVGVICNPCICTSEVNPVWCVVVAADGVLAACDVSCTDVACICLGSRIGLNVAP